MTRKDLTTEDPEAEAADWVIRLGDAEASEAAHTQMRAEFEEWLARGPLQRAAFAQVQRIWGDLGLLHAGDLGADFGADCDADTAMVPRKHSGVPFWLARAVQRPVLRPLAAVALLLILAAVGVSFWYGDPMVLMQADYRTARGDMRSVTLSDGSRVELASDSAIKVEFDSGSRRVELLRGTGYFIAAPRSPHEPRPFVVAAAGTTTTALGTEFMVEIAPQDLSVLVTKHAVRIAAGTEEVTLSEGHGLRIEAQGGFSDIGPGMAEFETSWRRGLLIFDDRPLGEVVQELNRYRHGKIVIRDKQLAARRVSGVFDIRGIGQAVDRIAQDLDLHVLNLPPMVTLLY